MRILLFIGTLRTGGAEAQTVRLTEGLARLGVDVELRTMFPGGQFWDQMWSSDGIRPRSLYSSVARSRAGRVLQILGAAVRLRRELRILRPSVILSSLYLSNLVAYRAWRGQPDCPLAWSIRCSTIPTTIPRSLYFKASRRWVSQVSAVVYNSHAGLANHLAAGFPAAGARVILNGIDSVRFRPDSARGREWRRRIGAGEDEALVGVAARLVEMKDHMTFLRAMARVAADRPGARFVCIGGGAAAYRRTLEEAAKALGIGRRVYWVGEERDMVGAYNGLDLLVSSSAAGEAFSNSIGEAMACGRACVATDVGDARRILGDTGLVVPPQDPEAMGKAVGRLLDESEEERRRRRQAARQRTEERFTVELMARETLELLTEQVSSWASSGGGPRAEDLAER